MPKVVEYPRRSLSDALELAEAVSGLGGRCSIPTCADSMQKRMGGAFSAVISAAVKYGLVTSKSGQLAVTDQFNKYRLAYNEVEKRNLLKQAFLSVPLFSQVFNRFRDEKLPGEILNKVLIREFDVNENIASAIRRYFIEGATATGLLTEDGRLVESSVVEEEEPTPDDDEPEHEEHAPQPTDSPVEPLGSDEEFSITIAGPGLRSTLVIRDPQDLQIVEAMLKKVRGKLGTAGDTGSSTSSDSQGTK